MVARRQERLPPIHDLVSAMLTDWLQTGGQPRRIHDHIGIGPNKVFGPRLQRGFDIDAGGGTHGLPYLGRNDQAPDLAAFGFDHHGSGRIQRGKGAGHAGFEGPLVKSRKIRLAKKLRFRGWYISGTQLLSLS